MFKTQIYKILGIFQGEDCPDYKKGAYNHALLAVGYGKENGKEYIKFMNR